MGSVVFLWPMHLLAGMAADLNDSRAELKGFDVLYDAEDTDGVPGLKLTVIFDIPSSRSVTGFIRLAVSGDRCPGGAEAERSVVLVMAESLRTLYGVFCADFNYIAIAEKRQLFNAMSDRLTAFRAVYSELVVAVKDIQMGFDGLCKELSAWLGFSHPNAEIKDIIAVSAFHACMLAQSSEMGRDIAHASLLVDMMMRRDEEPEMQRRFNETVPNPTVYHQKQKFAIVMPIDWEGSFFTLRMIYNEAIKKLNCVVSDINVVQMEDGLFKASIDLNSEPFIIWGSDAQTRRAAKAKLLFAVVKHVNTVLGYPIMDLHHPVRMYQENFVRRFDHKINGIWRCGDRMQRLLQAGQDSLVRNSANLIVGLADNACTEGVRVAIHSLQGRVVVARGMFDAAWASFVELKVDTATLQTGLLNAA